MSIVLFVVIGISYGDVSHEGGFFIKEEAEILRDKLAYETSNEPSVYYYIEGVSIKNETIPIHVVRDHMEAKAAFISKTEAEDYASDGDYEINSNAPSELLTEYGPCSVHEVDEILLHFPKKKR